MRAKDYKKLDIKTFQGQDAREFRERGTIRMTLLYFDCWKGLVK